MSQTNVKTHKPMPRRPLDFYETADWMVAALLRQVEVRGTVFEPCAGNGAIVDPLRLRGFAVTTNDLDPARQADTNDDALDSFLWERVCPQWTVTNPPFKHAAGILNNALRYSTLGVAMLLRLSFLEPTRGRQGLLGPQPPTRLIVLPRHSFTGDGKTDSVTCAWMAWEHCDPIRRITVASRPTWMDAPPARPATIPAQLPLLS